ncbi:mycofactocin biosynthesis glycosyltransferase MftF [Chloroflexota bacterium]
MNGFVFSLPDATYLEENSEGSFLISKMPIRMLRLNKSLFQALKSIEQNPFACINDRHLLPTLLSLTARGYLKLERVSAPAEYPEVSVIIPVRDQSADLAECLQSLETLNYPPDKLEIIVVDDGSRTPVSLSISCTGFKLMRLEESHGPAAARNLGISKANGDILAFLDADCTANENWLGELVPFFQIEDIGVVGGFVDSFYKKSLLDRYEEAFSSLNMGKRMLFEADTVSTFYVPTCNMLVRAKVLKETGGFNELMKAGEDVDFCWRIRELGYSLLYIPAGKVAHKHRNRLFHMLHRRSFYGTSEAVLYSNHKNKRKRFSIPIFAGLCFLALVIAILFVNPYPLCAIPPLLGIDLYRKYTTIRRYQMKSPFNQTLASMRSYLSISYFVSFHLIRYYLILVVALGLVFPSLWILGCFTLILSSLVDYYVKLPRVNYPVFLFFYTLEHLAYQAGVSWGCLKIGYFGSYIPVFSRVRTGSW